MLPWVLCREWTIRGRKGSRETRWENIHAKRYRWLETPQDAFSTTEAPSLVLCPLPQVRTWGSQADGRWGWGLSAPAAAEGKDACQYLKDPSLSLKVSRGQFSEPHVQKWSLFSPLASYLTSTKFPNLSMLQMANPGNHSAYVTGDHKDWIKCKHMRTEYDT